MADHDDRDTRDFFFPPGGEAYFAKTGDPIKRFEGASGQPITLYQGTPEAPTDYLVFEFGSWTLGVWAGDMTGQQLATWARNLHGRETDNGYFVLRATDSLRLSDSGLRLGTKTGPSVRLLPGPGCPNTQDQTRRSVQDDIVTLCHREWRMTIFASGSERFVDSVLSQLQIRDVRLGSVS